MTYWCWSTLLAGFGVVGLYLAGRSSAWGWALGLVDEALWILYAVTTRQWAFCLSAIAYGWVYGRNLRAWRRSPPRSAPDPPRRHTGTLTGDVGEESAVPAGRPAGGGSVGEHGVLVVGGAQRAG